MLGANQWGKSAVRVSKLLRGPAEDDFVDLTVSVILGGEVAAAFTDGDNSSVLPTDTVRNTIYGLAQEHLSHDLEGFGEILSARFLSREDVTDCQVVLKERIWDRRSPSGFVGGGTERRTATVIRGSRSSTTAGIAGLVLLKTRGSAFSGFPRDEFTALPETSDRILASSVTAEWLYTTVPADTGVTWALVRETLIDRFFTDPSESMQHQGYQMGEAVLEAVPEIAELTLRLPNQHHLPFDLNRFGLADTGTVFHPVSEPYGDISLTLTRG